MWKRILFIMVFSISAALTAQVKEVNIEWSSIKNSEGKIKLQEIKQWGGENAGKNELFKYPTDISRDSKGNYYVADMGENEISIFDKNEKYLKKIGRSGSGPGDLKYPIAIEIDSDDNLLVAEEGNRRIQIFDNGKSVNTIKPANNEYWTLRVDKKKRIAAKNSSVENGSSLLDLFGYNKKIIGKIGSFSNNKNEKGVNAYFAKSYFFALDKAGNYYIAYSHFKQRIDKYSPDGKLLMKINYKLALPPGEIKERKSNRGSAVIDEGRPEPLSMDTDGEGNIFLLIRKRQLEKEDYKYFPSFMSTSNDNEVNMTVNQPKERKNKYDLFALVVFDKEGNVTGMKSLDFFADKIKIVNGDVFIFNSYVDSFIKQYKFIK